MAVDRERMFRLIPEARAFEWVGGPHAAGLARQPGDAD